MSRGRPPIYKTEEERANANRAKSRKSYYKRRDQINRRKCEQRREANPELAVRKPLPPIVPKSKKSKGAKPIDFWLKLTEQVPDLFKELMGGHTSSRFLATVAHDYEVLHRAGEPEERCRADIERYLEEIDKLQKKLNRYFERFLNIVGLGKETSRVNEIAAEIREVEQTLQDLLVDIIEDFDAVARQIRLGRLTFT